MPRRPLRDFAEFTGFLTQREMTPATVIDVGVCYGTPELQDGFPGAYHIRFEPLAELEPRMQALTARYGGEYHMCALGDRPGTLPLDVPPGALQSATLARPKTGKNLRQVPVQTLDTVLGARDLARPLLLKTDCQGYDLNVMKGGLHTLARTDVVVMEVNMFDPAGDPRLGDFATIVGWMQGIGFSVYDILSYQTRPLDGALGYVDLAFVRTRGPLRADHRWQ
jgi:FkbM family methyltransferase